MTELEKLFNGCSENESEETGKLNSPKPQSQLSWVQLQKSFSSVLDNPGLNFYV